MQRVVHEVVAVAGGTVVVVYVADSVVGRRADAAAVASRGRGGRGGRRAAELAFARRRQLVAGAGGEREQCAPEARNEQDVHEEVHGVRDRHNARHEDRPPEQPLAQPFRELRLVQLQQLLRKSDSALRVLSAFLEIQLSK